MSDMSDIRWGHSLLTSFATVSIISWYSFYYCGIIGPVENIVLCCVMSIIYEYIKHFPLYSRVLCKILSLTDPSPPTLDLRLLRGSSIHDHTTQAINFVNE